MPNQEQFDDFEDVVNNGDECGVENPITSKTKGWPKGSRSKGGVEVAKKQRHCHFPNCGGTDHDSRNCPTKRKLWGNQFVVLHMSFMLKLQTTFCTYSCGV
ncbi:putative transcription factor interactor and regulator CCHC(Zn) family [Lupinus albus]|uniref:Putative transcription factor interactor and regulator CCHC(Zn) family n=1 Tax=Lupinus albus TaxID=3870 RepID=A0A6A4PU44_LUPAL|nr:putative transcription factor interactor and regulator CCHC(Zn) family [Lupinus albus]